MRRMLIARIALTLVGIVIWGYGNATNESRLMYAGMAVLAVALLLRFVPRRVLEEPPE